MTDDVPPEVSGSQKCRGPGCKQTNLCDAHIIPRGFARYIMDGAKNNTHVSMTKVRPTQHGVYDDTILCPDCDNILGLLDDYALGICKRFETDHVKLDGDGFVLDGVDGDKFCLFVLAVLWRASISSRPEFSKVSLGPYEDIVRDVIFGLMSLSAIPDFALLAARYTSANFRTDRLYTAPAKTTALGLDGFGFALCGLKIMVKLDPRPLPAILAPALVNGADKLTGVFVPFDGTTEHKAMIDMSQAHKARVGRKGKSKGKAR